MTQRRKQKPAGLLESAAEAIGAALGNIAVKTGLAKPVTGKKAAKRGPSKAAAKKKAAAKRIVAPKRPARKSPRS